MPILAIKGSGEKIWARLVESRSSGPFTCPSCKAEVLFVDANLKIKHFRHRVECECDSEPETVEHVWGKETVYDSIQGNFGEYVEAEDLIGRMKADVHWIFNDKKIAFEIQATNYDPSVFDEKIAYYTRRGYLTVYLFVGDNFGKTVKGKDNIYSLKEIEKRILYNKHYGDSVVGGYLDDDGVYLPNFQAKFAKGGVGFCENRFIVWRQHTKTLTLKDFLKTVLMHQINKKYEPPPCQHKHITAEKVTQKLTRYKEVCDDCGKFVRWIPNKEAINMGHQL